MWGKIAQGLKDNAGELAGDLRGGLAKLQDVVAPPHTPRPDEYDGREFNDNGDDEDEHDEDDQYRPRAIGFGSILSRIVGPMDDDEEEEEVEDEDVEESVEDFQKAPSSLVASEITVSSKILPPLDPSPMQKKPMNTSAATSRLVVPPLRTPTNIKNLVVPSASATKATTSASHDTKKLVVPSKATFQGAISNNLSSMSIISLETSSLPDQSASAPLDDSSYQALQQRASESDEKVRRDALLLQEHDARIQELQAREEWNAQKQAMEIAVMQQEKDNTIRELRQMCDNLQMRLRDETSVLQEKDNIIHQLEAKCLEFREKETIDDATMNALHEKDEQIRQLEETCQGLQAKTWIDPQVVREMSDKIRDLEAETITMQAKYSSVESAMVQQKDRKIQELEAKCHQINVAQSSLDSLTIQENDGKIHDLEAECHAMRVKIQSLTDQQELTRAEQEFKMKQQLEALEQKNQQLQESLDSKILVEKEEKIQALQAQCHELHMEMKRQYDQAKRRSRDTSAMDESASEEKLSALQVKCDDLEVQLRQREDHILIMQKDAVERMEAEEQWRNAQQLKFKQEQALMLEANAESVSAEYRQEIMRLETEIESMSQITKDHLARERNDALLIQRKLEHHLEEANARMAHIQAEKEDYISKSENSNKHLQKQEMAARQTEAKLIETKAILEGRNEELKSLKAMVKELQTNMRMTKGSSAEIQEELDHLREENETLHHNWQVTEDENDMLKKQIDDMAGNEDVIAALRKQIDLLKETKERERAEIESKVDSVESNKSALQEELDAARATVRDLDRQLSAALADVEVARSDLERAILGNENLSRALESFQSERDAELALLEERRMSSEEATAAAHAAAIHATHEANEMSMRQVRYAADAAVKQATEETRIITEALEQEKHEKLQIRRSLDEAISRLQASQDDVVDRSLMKNVLLDWFARSGKSKEQVLEVMASLLHFTDDEKEKIHLYEGNRLSQVISSVATLPPPSVDVNNLEGANVRDKFVNFLLAETDNF